MSNVIFARPHHAYQSYADFWRLVELAGYPIIYMDEIDPASDNCYIFSTPATHWHDGTERHGFPDAKARIIYYNLEWYANVDYRSIPGVELWGADKWYADLTGMRYVALGSDARLNPAPDQVFNKCYDLAHLSYLTHRRSWMVTRFEEKHFTLAPNGWGEMRHYALGQTRAMVHVHQEETAPAIGPQRWAIAAAYHLPMFSETCNDGGLFTPSNTLFADYGHLPEFIAMWLHEPRLTDIGNALYQTLCVDHPFKKQIEANL